MQWKIIWDLPENNPVVLDGGYSWNKPGHDYVNNCWSKMMDKINDKINLSGFCGNSTTWLYKVSDTVPAVSKNVSFASHLTLLIPSRAKQEKQVGGVGARSPTCKELEIYSASFLSSAW